jgi:amino acid transporter
MVIGYGIVTTCVASFLQTMSEMTIAFPTSGNFIDFAARFVDPAWAFSAGMAEWLGMVFYLKPSHFLHVLCRYVHVADSGWTGWTAVAAAEAVFFDIIINRKYPYVDLICIF